MLNSSKTVTLHRAAVYRNKKGNYYLYVGKTYDGQFLWIELGNLNYYINAPVNWIDYLLQIPSGIKNHLYKTSTIKKNLVLEPNSIGMINLSNLSDNSKQILRFHGLEII